MNLNLTNASVENVIFSWIVPIPFYKIKSITVVSSKSSFFVNYKDGTQYLESGRTDTCPIIFTGNFSALFYNMSAMYPIDSQCIQDIQIELIEC